MAKRTWIDKLALAGLMTATASMGGMSYVVSSDSTAFVEMTRLSPHFNTMAYGLYGLATAAGAYIASRYAARKFGNAAGGEAGQAQPGKDDVWARWQRKKEEEKKAKEFGPFMRHSAALMLGFVLGGVGGNMAARTVLPPLEPPTTAVSKQGERPPEPRPPVAPQRL